MAENLVQKVQDMLKEATWTRATISNYTQNNLKELDEIIAQAHSDNCVNEILDVCEEQLSHSKDSIIALYIASILSLQNGVIDTTNLETLVDIFQKNHKEAIVVSLCKKILSEEVDPTNKFAMRTLANCYMSENNPEVWDVYTNLVKIDVTEAETAKILAEHYEEAGDTEKATEYYKKAILRFINNNNYNACKDVWTKLVQLIPAEFDFFQLIRRKISKTFGDIRTTTLMQELYSYYKDNQLWETAIVILKQNLEVEPKDNWARKEIVDCYRGLYAKHSHLEEYIRNSNLTASYRNVFEAINDFEKHIAFDKNTFVYHRTWGIGIIRKLENDTLYINFGGKTGEKQIALKMAVTALKPLPKDHIWVKKATARDKNVLKEDIKNNPEKWLEIIIKSFDNNCDFKRIKAELVDSILTPGEWTSWNTKAKKILAENSKFGVNPSDVNMYTVRDKEITKEEKLSNEFKAEKQFFSRIDILMKFIKDEETDNSSELFAEMYGYFTGYLKNISKVNEQVIAAYLVARYVSGLDKQFIYPVKETFAELYGRLEDPRKTYEALKDTKNTSLKKDFIECIRMLPDWYDQYIKLFPTVLDLKLLEALVSEGHKDEVVKFVKICFEQYKDYREPVLIFFKECQKESWFIEANIPYEKQLITLINIIEISYRETINHVNSTENKKIKTTALTLLFKNNTLFDYMFKKDEETVKKLYTLIDDLNDIDPAYKAAARNKILEKYPDFKFRVSEDKSSKPSGMLVTAKMKEIKKAEMENIQNVLMPANAKDIADAREKGDLKENQEYKAAREKQHMLQLDLSRLQVELNRAVIFDPTTVTNGVISFGTTVVLHNEASNADETYTVLGPWESNPDENIISYMSPFGNAMLDKKTGEKFNYTVEGSTTAYTVKSIAKAKI